MWARFKTNGNWHKVDDEDTFNTGMVYSTACGLRVKSYSFEFSYEVEPILKYNSLFPELKYPICPKCKGQHVIDLIK